VEKFCGDADKYCPGGDFRPIAVSLGYFSTGKNRASMLVVYTFTI